MAFFPVQDGKPGTAFLRHALVALSPIDYVRMKQQKYHNRKAPEKATKRKRWEGGVLYFASFWYIFDVFAEERVLKTELCVKESSTSAGGGSFCFFFVRFDVAESKP
eukprot:Hpha_TRINITY_DN16823_c1_g3::TRINITY_DN16823_c1_g3_i1::g.150364::m.150364